MNVLLKQREVGFYLEDSGAKLLFAWSAFAEDAEAGAAAAGADCVLVDPTGFVELVGAAEPVAEVAERDDDDTAVILYTSGTTGHPEGRGADALQPAMQRRGLRPSCSRSRDDDVIFGGLPLFHVFGLTCGLNTAIRAGATLTLLPRFDPTKALEIIERDRVTIFEGVPTMYVALLNHPRRADYDVSALRVCVSGGAAMPVEVLRAFEEAFGCTVLEGYGLSETSPVASFNHPRPTSASPARSARRSRASRCRLVDDDGNELAGRARSARS